MEVENSEIKFIQVKIKKELSYRIRKILLKKGMKAQFFYEKAIENAVNEIEEIEKKEEQERIKNNQKLEN